MSILFNEIFEAVLAGQQTEVEAKVQQAINERLGSADILNKGLISAMQEVGLRYERGRRGSLRD